MTTQSLRSSPSRADDAVRRGNEPTRATINRSSASSAVARAGCVWGLRPPIQVVKASALKRGSNATKRSQRQRVVMPGRHGA